MVLFGIIQCNYNVRRIRKLGSTSTLRLNMSFSWLTQFSSELVGYLKMLMFADHLSFFDMLYFNSRVQCHLCRSTAAPNQGRRHAWELAWPAGLSLECWEREQTCKCDAVWWTSCIWWESATFRRFRKIQFCKFSKCFPFRKSYFFFKFG